MIKRIAYVTFLVLLWIGGMSLEAVVKSAVLTLFGTYILIPLLWHYLPSVQRHLIFLTFVNYPWKVNFDEPEKEGVPGARNFYLNTESNIQVGVWHILPVSLISKAPAKGEANFVEWYEASLADEHPVLLYLHGNTSSRAVAHRLELYDVLRNLGWHIVAFDYRGYADSSNVTPTETGVVHDAKYVYRYVRNLVGASPLIVWGHSLGTGVSCHAIGDLCLEGEAPTALILESAFNNIKDEVTFHPLTALFKKMPLFHWFFLNPLKGAGIDFRSDYHIGHIPVPILIMHAKDDLVVPFILGKRLYETALKVRSRKSAPVKFIAFERQRGLGHKFICRAEELPEILRRFKDEVVKKN